MQTRLLLLGEDEKDFVPKEKKKKKVRLIKEKREEPKQLNNVFVRVKNFRISIRCASLLSSSMMRAII